MTQDEYERALAGQTNVPLANPKPAEFNRAAGESLVRADELCEERGGQYLDSWALSNQYAPFTDQVRREIGPNRSLTTLSLEERRLLRAAEQCDTKLSRLLGPYKGDTYIDLINYIAALRTWMDEYVQQKAQAA